MSTHEDRHADAREWAREISHGPEPEAPECPEQPCHDYPLCGHVEEDGAKVEQCHGCGGTGEVEFGVLISDCTICDGNGVVAA